MARTLSLAKFPPAVSKEPAPLGFLVCTPAGMDGGEALRRLGIREVPGRVVAYVLDDSAEEPALLWFGPLDGLAPGGEWRREC